MLRGNILITGGAGTLGRAIISRIKAERWPVGSITVYSRDPLKHQAIKRDFPSRPTPPYIRTVLGDIRDTEHLQAAMVGHNIVIHAAAQKHIPEGEAWPGNCIETNVDGSRSVAYAAVQAGVERCIGISTDKVCHPINVYGHTKALMEAIWREWAASSTGTIFNLCRYGNVIGSNGSVVQVWRRQMESGLPPTITSREMTRFWITEADAVNLVLETIKWPAGVVVAPLAPALDMGKFAQYILGDVETEEIGLRPGEKMHEMLVAPHEEIMLTDRHAIVNPGTAVKTTRMPNGYTSDAPLHELTERELRGMVGQ